MGQCGWCKKEMSGKGVDSCDGNKTVEYPDKTILPSVPYNPSYGGIDQRCH
jgi:hypothetical protein